MYGLVGRHKWSKWSILSYFLQKRVFSQNRVFDTSSNLHVIDLRNGATISLTFFLSVLLGCLLGPLPELDMKLNFLMT